MAYTVLAKARAAREEGRHLFAAANFALAVGKFQSAIALLHHGARQAGGEHEDERRLWRQLGLNMALCHQRMGEYRSALDACTKVIEGDGEFSPLPPVRKPSINRCIEGGSPLLVRLSVGTAVATYLPLQHGRATQRCVV